MLDHILGLVSKLSPLKAMPVAYAIYQISWRMDELCVNNSGNHNNRYVIDFRMKPKNALGYFTCIPKPELNARKTAANLILAIAKRESASDHSWDHSQLKARLDNLTTKQ